VPGPTALAHLTGPARGLRRPPPCSIPGNAASRQCRFRFFYRIQFVEKAVGAHNGGVKSGIREYRRTDGIESMIWRSLVLILFLASACRDNCLAQTPTEDDRLAAARTYQPSPVMSFLSLFRGIAGRAESANASGKEGRPISTRTYLAARLRPAELDENQLSAVQAIATEYMERVNAVDAQARELITRFREAARAGRRPPTEDKEELQRLEQQRDTIVSEEMQKLETAIGKDAYERITKALAPTVTEDEFGRKSASAAQFTIPEGLHRPAPLPPGAKGSTVRESEFESRLPVGITIATRPANRRVFRLGQTIELWITLTNRAETSIRIHPRDVLKHFGLRCRAQAGSIPGPPATDRPWPTVRVDAAPLIEYLPIAQTDEKGREVIDLPSQSPIEVAVLRIPLEPEAPRRSRRGVTTLGPGAHDCVFERPLSVIADEEETVEFANMALRSNTLAIVVTR